MAAAAHTGANVLEKVLDKAWESKPLAEVVAAPISVLQGVTPKDAELIQQALQIKSVADLATNKFVLRAQALMTLSKA